METNVTQHSSTIALKAINTINPTGPKAFYSAVTAARGGKAMAHAALDGMVPSLTQYILALKAAEPQLVKVGLQVDIDVPEQGEHESADEYTARLMGAILSSLGGGLTRHTGKDTNQKMSTWQRQEQGLGLSLVSAKLTLTRIEMIDGRKQVKSYRAIVGDDVAAKNVSQYIKEIREKSKAIDEGKVVQLISTPEQTSTYAESVARTLLQDNSPAASN